MVKPKNYKIEILNAEDWHLIAGFADQILGEGYLQSVIDSCNNYEKRILYVAKTDKGILIGFCLSYIYNSHLLPEDYKSEKLLGFINFNSPVAILKTIAVKKLERNKGIADGLMACFFERVKANKVGKVISPAWVQNNKINALGLLQRVNFRVIDTLSLYWYYSSLQYGFICPECGVPCKCDAVILGVDI